MLYDVDIAPCGSDHTHYSDVIMSGTASQTTRVSIVCTTVCLGADQRKHQSSASLFEGNSSVTGVFPAQRPVTRKTIPFDDVIIRGHDDEGCNCNHRAVSTSDSRSSTDKQHPLSRRWVPKVQLISQRSYIQACLIRMEETIKNFRTPNYIKVMSHERRGVPNHRQTGRLFSDSFRLTSKALNLALLLICKGNGLPAQRTSNAENLSMSRSRHELTISMQSNPRTMMEATLLNFFEQLQLMMTSLIGNIFRVTGPLCGEFTGHRWIPHTKASDAELWIFLWSAREQTVVQAIATPVIWDAITLVMTSLQCKYAYPYIVHRTIPTEVH